MNSNGMNSNGMTRRARAMVVSAVTVVTVVSLTGCGLGNKVLGIRDAPTANTTSAPMTAGKANDIVVRAFTAAQQAETSTGDESASALKTAYTGEALKAATARIKLADIKPSVADSPVLAPQQPRLLSVPRGFGYPRVIVAQTTPAEGRLPILHLLTSPDAATPYRISMSATMLLDSKIAGFDPVSKGSPLVTSGTGLAVAPAALLTAYAAGLAFPAKTDSEPLFTADPFAAQVRGSVAAVAKAVTTQANVFQGHKVVPNSVFAVGQANGDALVFGVMERTDTFAVKSGESVNTTGNKAFVALSGKKSIFKESKVTTAEFVVFVVPRSSGQATLVGASEQVVAGSGS